MTLYELDISNFIRLIVKKNSETFETIKRLAALKIRYRNSTIRGGIPLYAALIAPTVPQSTEGMGPSKSFLKQNFLEKKKEGIRERFRGHRMKEGRNKALSTLQKVTLSYQHQ